MLWDGECGGQVFRVFIGDCRAGAAYQCQGCGVLDKGRWTAVEQPAASKPNGNAALEGTRHVENDVVSPRTKAHGVIVSNPQ